MSKKKIAMLEMVPEIPPNRAGGKRDSAATRWLEEVAKFPLVWFKFPERKTSTYAQSLKKMALKVGNGDFQVVSRKTEDCPPKTAWVYAQYLGLEDAPAEDL